MNVIKTAIDGVVIIEPKVFGDERGFSLETFQADRYQELGGIDLPFVQDNHSRSVKGVLRGLHFQVSKPQGKLVRVVSGEVYDVALDIRKESPTFGKWEAVVLSEDNKKQFWVPPGFAHGFLCLGKENIVDYSCTNYRSIGHEYSLLYNDKKVNMKWPLKKIIISDKDKNAKTFNELLNKF